MHSTAHHNKHKIRQLINTWLGSLLPETLRVVSLHVIPLRCVMPTSADHQQSASLPICRPFAELPLRTLKGLKLCALIDSDNTMSDHRLGVTSYSRQSATIQEIQKGEIRRGSTSRQGPRMTQDQSNCESSARLTVPVRASNWDVMTRLGAAPGSIRRATR